MVLPPIKIDTGIEQFQDLERLFDKANVDLRHLKTSRPEYGEVWKNVSFRLGLIQKSLETKTIPTRKKKKEAVLGTMLIYECPDMNGSRELSALFELDNAYQHLGIKSLTNAELDTFRKEMGCRM